MSRLSRIADELRVVQASLNWADESPAELLGNVPTMQDCIAQALAECVRPSPWRTVLDDLARLLAMAGIVVAVAVIVAAFAPVSIPV